MKVTTAKVTNGRLDVDAEAFPEGKMLKVVLLEEEPVRLSEEEKQWLSAALAESHRGDRSDALAFMDTLDRSK